MIFDRKAFDERDPLEETCVERLDTLSFVVKDAYRGIINKIHYLVHLPKFGKLLGVVRRQFIEIIPLGRDFLRLLGSVASLPQIGALLYDIEHAPAELHPEFFGLRHLGGTPTPAEYLLLLVTPEIEFKLVFFLNQVTENVYHVYLRRFVARFLSTEAAETLYPDIIRYICSIIHPRNSVLKSSVVQRWKFIQSLMTEIKLESVAQQSKLALYYDWLFFNPASDSFMTLEPSILIIYRSALTLPSCPHVAANLLEFLHSIVDQYFPAGRTAFQDSVRTSMRTLLEFKVIQTLDPLYQSTKLGDITKTKLKDLFPMYCIDVSTKQPARIDPSTSELNALVETLLSPDHSGNSADWKAFYRLVANLDDPHKAEHEIYAKLFAPLDNEAWRTLLLNRIFVNTPEDMNEAVLHFLIKVSEHIPDFALELVKTAIRYGSTRAAITSCSVYPKADKGERHAMAGVIYKYLQSTQDTVDLISYIAVSSLANSIKHDRIRLFGDDLVPFLASVPTLSPYVLYASCQLLYLEIVQHQSADAVFAGLWCYMQSTRLEELQQLCKRLVADLPLSPVMFQVVFSSPEFSESTRDAIDRLRDTHGRSLLDEVYSEVVTNQFSAEMLEQASRESIESQFAAEQTGDPISPQELIASQARKRLAITSANLVYIKQNFQQAFPA
ncbi:Integrator complex subunit 3 [Kappamyces sp. JEL0680]|nr:Integrator complex subunit 3 [Kappamyces sp. JEL0680]